MIVVNYGRPEDTQKRVVAQDDDDVTIGTKTGNHVILMDDDVVEEHHARLTYQAPNWVLHASGPTTVNGHPVAAPTIVTRDEEIRIGSHVLWIEPAPAEQREDDLVAAARLDEAGIAVYADWLEERGQWDRVDLLRHELALAAMPPGDPRRDEQLRRIGALARSVDRVWRARTAHAPVEGCQMACNRDWASLEDTDAPTLRRCTTCSRTVMFCYTEDAARDQARVGHPIALEPGVQRQGRTYDDYVRDRTHPMAWEDSGYRICPVCHASQPTVARYCRTCGEPRT